MSSFKCVFVSVKNSGEIGYAQLSWEEVRDTIESFGDRVEAIRCNCNRDTLLFPNNSWKYKIEWNAIWNIDDIFRTEGDTVSVILKWENGTIYYIANMNREAFKNSQRDNMLWVYSKTNKQLQKKWATSGDLIELDWNSFQQWVDKNGEVILIVNVRPTKNSVCHVKNPETNVWYPTCFFRNVSEMEGKF